jgi:hypothetical protein
MKGLFDSTHTHNSIRITRHAVSALSLVIDELNGGITTEWGWLCLIDHVAAGTVGVVTPRSVRLVLCDPLWRYP